MIIFVCLSGYHFSVRGFLFWFGLGFVVIFVLLFVFFSFIFLSFFHYVDFLPFLFYSTLFTQPSFFPQLSLHFMMFSYE